MGNSKQIPDARLSDALPHPLFTARWYCRGLLWELFSLLARTDHSACQFLPVAEWLEHHLGPPFTAIHVHFLSVSTGHTSGTSLFVVATLIKFILHLPSESLAARSPLPASYWMPDFVPHLLHSRHIHMPLLPAELTQANSVSRWASRNGTISRGNPWY
jgi:hypothetical protein